MNDDWTKFLAIAIGIIDPGRFRQGEFWLQAATSCATATNDFVRSLKGPGKS